LRQSESHESIHSPALRLSASKTRLLSAFARASLSFFVASRIVANPTLQPEQDLRTRKMIRREGSP
jgi:hypothetical protein